jgi:uncharacterized protein (DUF1697 family)
MPTYIALLRGINVSGQKLIKMANLQAHFASGGADNVRTYIQSGNVVFEHRAATTAAVRKKLEKHLAGELGYAVPTIVKSAREFAAIAEANPHDTGLPEFGRRMYVCFFEKTPSPDAVEGIQSLITDDERLVISGSAGYVYYAAGLGRAKLTGTLIERKLGLATMRNWNTVTALAELAGLYTQA